ncbi:hypothetical protein [Clostridium sp. 'White wine YQ']|uniref:hypothetical protein n=1 Tax=Clostridium sp. 'White wine YQ' TaxID=3027474 RepID=UPI0023672A82|nr:hypothetical protein [Clostridium sp. 'White wine YQ']MDD7795873.1 hypothetical protein [Clostridium sp. 'White wine YQ']
MNDRELLELLNLNYYSEEEIKDLEYKAIETKETIGENIYKVKNDKVLRKIAYIELEQIVKSKLDKSEIIKYKMIALQSYMQDKKYVGGLMAPDRIVYLGLFVTDERIYMFKLGLYYNILEECIYEISDLVGLVDTWERYKTIGLKFDEINIVKPSPYGEENEKIFLEIIRYLRDEKGVAIEEYKKTRMSKSERIIFIIFMIIFLASFIYGTFSYCRDTLNMFR